MEKEVTKLFDDGSMKPMMVIPPGTMSPEDIALLRENGICVVVSKDPAALRFLDPIPTVSSRSQIEHAAIQLSRKILNKETWINRSGTSATWHSLDRSEVIAMFLDLMVKGTPLDSDITQQEREERLYNSEKSEEISKLAREDARAERAAKKAAKK